MYAALIVLLVGQYGISGFAGDPKARTIPPKVPAARVAVPIEVPPPEVVVSAVEPVRAVGLTEAEVVQIVRRELASVRACGCAVQELRATPVATVQGCMPAKTASFNGTEPGSVLVFSTARCGWCERLERESLVNFNVPGKHLHRVDAGQPANAACVAHYGVKAYPTIVVIDEPGRFRKHEGYLDRGGFSAFVGGGGR